MQCFSQKIQGRKEFKAFSGIQKIVGKQQERHENAKYQQIDIGQYIFT
jgi:hypothetical protein